jgi:hypothetical protein
MQSPPNDGFQEKAFSAPGMSREAGESTWAFLGRVKKGPWKLTAFAWFFQVASLVIGLASFLGRLS